MSLSKKHAALISAGLCCAWIGTANGQMRAPQMRNAERLPQSAASDAESSAFDTASPVPRPFTVVLRDGADGNAVAAYFTSFGFQAIYEPAIGVVSLRGTFAQAERAGHFQYATAAHDSRGPITVATARPVFGAVSQWIIGTSFGLGPRAQPLRTTLYAGGPVPRQTNIPATGCTPGDFANFYQISPVYRQGIDGTGETIDIAACGSIYPEDLAYFDKLYGLKDASVTVIAVDGGPYYYGLEPALDVQRVHGTAPGAQIRLFTLGACYESLFVDLFAAIARDQAAHPADALTISYGSGEREFSYFYGNDDLVQAQSAMLQRIAAHNVTILAASGDSGSWAAYPYPPSAKAELDVSYPASDPNVIAVGGTTLLPNPVAGLSPADEHAWSGSGPTGSGGGVSKLFALPAYQKGVAGMASQTRKNLPDISLIADPYTGAAVIFGAANGVTAPIAVGGTSASSPTFAGILALINQARHKAGEPTLTNTASRLYALPEDFHDIVAGNNGFFNAAIGYDNVTGLGTPNVEALVRDLK